MPSVRAARKSNKNAAWCFNQQCWLRNLRYCIWMGACVDSWVQHAQYITVCSFFQHNWTNMQCKVSAGVLWLQLQMPGNIQTAACFSDVDCQHTWICCCLCTSASHVKLFCLFAMSISGTLPWRAVSTSGCVSHRLHCLCGMLQVCLPESVCRVLCLP